ncbi:MAG: hypothetical protein KF678_13365 [Phycisphaeraceae bacterium]|nr:hypothetical protein [Phycisphaeraceae bacterium]
MLTFVSAASLVGMVGLGGCTYTADVRNMTGEPVFVQMLQVDAIQPDWVLDSVRVGPGEHAKLGPKRVAFQRVVIDAGTQTKKSVNGRALISPGMTRLDVTSASVMERDETVFTVKRRDE